MIVLCYDEDLSLLTLPCGQDTTTMHMFVSHHTPYLSSCALLASILRMLLSAKGQPDRLKNTSAQH